MSYYDSVRNSARITDFHTAQSYFANTPTPRGASWKTNERPLIDTTYGRRLHHYRMAQNIFDGEVCYDVILYNTVMARYYPLDADGGAYRLYMGHSSHTSQQFMSHVLQMGDVSVRQSRVVPIYTKDFTTDRNASFSLRLYVKDGVIDFDKSKHTQHYVLRSNKEDKQARLDALAKLDTYIMMAQMRIPEYIENVTLNERLGGPFGGKPLDYAHKLAIQDLLYGDANQAKLDVFFEIGQLVFDILASKRAFAEDLRIGSRYKYMYAHQAQPIANYSELKKKVTADEFKKSLIAKILPAIGLDKKSNKVEIPQFVVEKDYPRTSIKVY